MSPAKATATAKASILSGASAPTILVIEDYPDTRELLVTLLQRGGL